MSDYLLNPITEHVSREHFFLMKIPTGEAQARVPAPFKVQEIARGTALFGIGIQRITGASFCRTPGFDKIYLTYAIQPRYDTGTASPRFSFFVYRIHTGSPVFLDGIERINHSPVYRRPGLDVAFDPDSQVLVARDDDGKILELRSTHPKPVYRQYTVWNQAAAHRDGRSYLQATEWTGEAFEHQISPDVGEICRHPLFGDQPVEGLGARAYHQLVMRPGSAATMTLYQPVAQGS